MITVIEHEGLCKLINACRQGADNTTPISLVQKMIDKIPEELWKNPLKAILDPSAGSGTFLVAAYWKMIQAGDTHENIIKNRLFACEINLIYLKVLRDKLGLKNIYNKDFLQFNNNMKFDVIVGNPPYQETLGASRGKSIWDRFVLKSYSLLKPKGYLGLIHPGSWRAPKGKFKHIQKLYKENNLLFLKLSDYKQGSETFGVGTNYDYFILQNTNNQGKTQLIDTENNSDVIDISLLEFIPNTQLNVFKKLIAKPGEEKVQLLGDSSYHSQRDYISNIQSNEFQYPVIWSITQSKGINLKYSKINTKGHFNQPKVIFSHGGGTYPIIDATGEFGLTEFGFGIVDKVPNLKSIQKALESSQFLSLMASAGFRNLKYEPKVIEKFRKDFWKEFI